MRSLRIMTAVAAVCFAAAGAHAVHEIIPAETIERLPGPYAAGIYRYLTVEYDYKKWIPWPGRGKLYRGSPPHGAYLTTYVNSYAANAFGTGGKMEPGSLIVQENYNEDRKLDSIHVMYKIKDFNPSGGDWYWARYDTRGRAADAGIAGECIQCHAKQKANDFVFTGEFVK